MFAKKVSDKERKQMAKQEKKQVALEKKGAGYGMKERVLTYIKNTAHPCASCRCGMYGYLHCHGEQGRRSAAQGTGCGHEVRCGS